MQGLKYQDVYEEYVKQVKERGGSSCEAVALALKERGIYNVDTGRPYTRQAVRVMLSKTPEGRVLLDAPEKREHKQKPSLIVDGRKGIVEWLRRKGLEYEQVSSPTPVQVEGRYVYGNLPLTVAVSARSVWLVCVQGDPVVVDAGVEQLNQAGAELREFKIRRIQ